MSDAKSDVNQRYASFHAPRIDWTISLLRKHGAQRVIEMGGHPWTMTRCMVDAGLDVVATVSAEEELLWPDPIAVTRSPKRLQAEGGPAIEFVNSSANLERTRFAITESADAVVAAEIVEHLVRAPHVLLLNANDWLTDGGLLVLTTPNGASFQNPLRVRSRTNAYRARIYERHTYMFERRQLEELVTLCGFDIVESGYASPYARRGKSVLYDWLARLPFRRCQDLFSRTIFIVARKRAPVAELPCRPSCYAPGPWEFIEGGE